MNEVGFVGAADAAAIIGHGEAQVWRLTRTGRFPAPIRIGRRTLWRRDEVIAWVERETAAYRAGRRPTKSARLPTKYGRRSQRNSATEGIPPTDAAAVPTIFTPTATPDKEVNP